MEEWNPGVIQPVEEECHPRPFQVKAEEAAEEADTFHVDYRPKTEGPAKTNPGKGVQADRGIRSQ